MKLLVYHTMNGIVDISEYLRIFSIFPIIPGGLLLRKILFQAAKFVYRSRHKTDFVVKWGRESG